VGSTPEQQQAAQAALDVFAGYVNFVNVALADPTGPDWAAQAPKYLAEAEAAELIDSLGRLVQGGVRQVTPPSYEDARATAVSTNQVTVVVCIDSTPLTAVDDSGDPVDLPATNSPRALTTAEINYFGADKGWLITKIGGHNQARPC